MMQGAVRRLLGHARWALCSGFLLVCVPQAQAWGVKGHAAIADLAQAALSPAAQAQVKLLLADDLDRGGQPSGRHTLAEVASWADEIREGADAKTYRGWHVRGNSVCSAELGACPDGHCVDQLILHYAAILADRDQAPRARNEALKWVVHLVGDLHQPLHSGVAKDKGALPVALAGVEDGKRRTLHQVWDSELAAKALKLGRLHLPAELPAYAPEDVAGWMQESRQLALEHAYTPLPGFACGSWNPPRSDDTPMLLDEAYQVQALPVIRLQMERAAARLAVLLNTVLQ
ncbi:S1/P1 nuclease [Uliginosibacterium gangwonense]|uniref:S1/P1 nuclease n=1 Tax=Uliginosibacterium gangwonense TaxID=392736 RepID=UPI00036FDCCF|nr:S1/P1 nuclease [Uliginosibacterium gangwonense]